MSNNPEKNDGPNSGHNVNTTNPLHGYIKLLTNHWPTVILATGLIGAAYMGYKSFQNKTYHEGRSIIGITTKIRIPGEKRVEYLKPAPTYWSDLERSMTSDTVWHRTVEQVRENHPTPVNTQIHYWTASRLGESSSFEFIVHSNNKEYARQLSAYWITNFVQHKDLKTLNEFSDKKNGLEKNKTKWIRNLTNLQKEYDELILKHGATGNENLVTPIREEIVATRRQINETELEIKKWETADQEYIQFQDSAASLFSDSRTKQPIDAIINDMDENQYRMIVENPTYRKIILELAILNEELEDQIEILKPDFPILADLSNQIEELHSQKNRLFSLENTHPKKRVTALQSKKKLLENHVKDQENALKGALVKHQELTKKLNEMNDAKTRLDEYSQLLRFFQEEPESEFYEILTTGSVVTIEPKRLKKTLTGLMFGLIAGLGFVYLLNVLDRPRFI